MVNDLTSFMNLFDEVEQLLSSSGKSASAILDQDCSNSIIGKVCGACLYGKVEQRVGYSGTKKIN